MTETTEDKPFPRRNFAAIARPAPRSDDLGRGDYVHELAKDRDPSYPANQKNVPPKMKLTPAQQKVWDQLLIEQQESHANDPEWQRRRKVDGQKASREKSIRQRKK